MLDDVLVKNKLFVLTDLCFHLGRFESEVHSNRFPTALWRTPVLSSIIRIETPIHQNCIIDTAPLKCIKLSFRTFCPGLQLGQGEGLV